MHSCGKIESFIPDFIEAGIDVLQALQANTGMDVVKLKEKYGDSIVFFGNIAEAALAGTKEDIRREIEYKVGIAKKGGGYIYHSDHSVPDEVSFENYVYAMEMVEKYGSYK
jgi:uroporphyrinogen decarboxylase